MRCIYDVYNKKHAYEETRGLIAINFQKLH